MDWTTRERGCGPMCKCEHVSHSSPFIWLAYGLFLVNCGIYNVVMADIFVVQTRTCDYACVHTYVDESLIIGGSCNDPKSETEP